MTTVPRASKNEAIVVAYWHQYVTATIHGDRVEADRWFWAWQAVEELVRADPERAIYLVVELADYCVSAQALAYLGAGPVEDLVKRVDDELFARILKLARKSARFRRALATIWIDDEARTRELRVLFGQCPPAVPDGVLDDAVGP